MVLLVIARVVEIRIQRGSVLCASWIALFHGSGASG